MITPVPEWFKGIPPIISSMLSFRMEEAWDILEPSSFLHFFIRLGRKRVICKTTRLKFGSRWCPWSYHSLEWKWISISPCFFIPLITREAFLKSGPSSERFHFPGDKIFRFKPHSVLSWIDKVLLSPNSLNYFSTRGSHMLGISFVFKRSDMQTIFT